MRLKQSRDILLNRALFKRGMPGDLWVGDHHTFWIAYDGETPVGFCSAVYIERDKTAFLSSAVVFAAARGTGLQRRMVRVRRAWAARQGAAHIVTYVVEDNYASLVNLLRCGFRFYTPSEPWAGKRSIYLQRPI